MSYLWAICEDEAEDREELAAKVRKWAKQRRFEVNLELFANPRDMREVLDRFDAFLLDIYMPEDAEDGWKLAQSLRSLHRHAPVVFVTASEEHILPAYELQNIIGYVLKPLQEENLNRALDNLSRLMQSRDEEYFVYPATFFNSEGERYSGVCRLPYREILFFCSEKNRNYIQINGRAEPRLRQTIKGLFPLLPESFHLADKSLIINLNRVYQLHQDYVIFNDEARSRQCISRGYHSIMQKAYLSHRFQGLK